MIEVEGESSPPSLNPTSARFKNLQRTWENWRSYTLAASKGYGIPAAWIVAIQTIETGFLANDPEAQATVVSPAGAAGVMQLMPKTATMLGLSVADRANPELNIMAGTALLRRLADGPTGPELPNIASAYNAGPGSGSLGVRCSAGRNEWNLVADANYPRQAIENQNAARMYLDLGGTGISAATVVGFGIAVAGLAMAVYLLAPVLRRAA